MKTDLNNFHRHRRCPLKSHSHSSSIQAHWDGGSTLEKPRTTPDWFPPSWSCQGGICLHTDCSLGGFTDSGRPVEHISTTSGYQRSSPRLSPDEGLWYPKVVDLCSTISESMTGWGKQSGLVLGLQRLLPPSQCAQIDELCEWLFRGHLRSL